MWQSSLLDLDDLAGAVSAYGNLHVKHFAS
jgi:hypothetical protein